MLLGNGDDVGGGAAGGDAGQWRILLLDNVIRYDGSGRLGGLYRGSGRGGRRNYVLILVWIDRTQFHIVDIVLDEIRGDCTDLLIVGEEV